LIFFDGNLTCSTTEEEKKENKEAEMNVFQGMYLGTWSRARRPQPTEFVLLFIPRTAMIWMNE